MKHQITLLQKAVIYGVLYPYGTVFEFDKAFLAWLRQNRINHQVTRKEALNND